MVTVTERAASVLKELQADQEEGPDQILRIVKQDDDYELTFDTEREGDQIVESEGASVLLIGEDVATALDGAVIDCEDTAEGPRFTLSTDE